MKILLINQAFYPDKVSTSQHLTDLALDLAAKGHRVSVIAGNHSYADPSEVYPLRENYRGIQITRIRYASQGKLNRLKRFWDFASFHLHLFPKLIRFPRQEVVIGLTSPPLVGLLAGLFCAVKGGTFVTWVMDMNPDEAIAAGWLRPTSLPARFLNGVSKWIFRRSQKIIVLDRFMKQRIQEKYGIDENRMVVAPPWAHDQHLKPIPHEKNVFRAKYFAPDDFVVMYSGNHSPCHSLDTVLETALYYRGDKKVRFCFIGGGSLVKNVSDFRRSNNLENILQLPYQRLEDLSASLSAADLHVAVMGNDFVGIVHPCKAYGILAVGRPFVFIGPKHSHMGDLIRETGVGHHIEHADVHGFVSIIEAFRSQNQADKEENSRKAMAVKDERFSQKKLAANLVRLVEESRVAI